MNRKYHEFIENSDIETVDFGEYCHPRTRIFGLPILPFYDKCDTWKLPMRMFDQGLFVIGDSWSESKRLQFTSFYAKSLLDNGVRVIYITDALTKTQHNHDSKSHIDNFDKNIGLSHLADNEIHSEDLSGEFNPQIFEGGVKLSVVRYKSEVSHQDKNKQGKLGSDLVSLLNNIGESGIARYERGISSPDVVVILEECGNLTGFDANELEKAICLLKGRGFGVVVSCNGTKMFKGIVNSFGHYAFFRMDDPYEELCNHDFFFPNLAKCRSDTGYARRIHVEPIDFQFLTSCECHYITRKQNSTEAIHCFGMFKQPE